MPIPPGRYGLPLAGEMIPLYSDFYGFAQRKYQRYGPIFRTHANYHKAVVLLSAEAQQHVLLTHQKNFTAGVGYAPIHDLMQDALILLDGTVHRQQRSWMTPAFHGRNMPAYLATIERIFDEHLAAWGKEGTVAFYPAAAAMTFELGAALFLGLELRDDKHHLLELWTQYAAGVNTLLHVKGPFTTYGRSFIARAKIDALVRGIIAQERASATQSLVHLLTEARDEAGNAMPEADLVTQLRFLLFASYDTTTGTLAWLLAELLRHPDLLARVRAEVAGDADKGPLTYADLTAQRPLTDAVINETLRLHPQVMMFARGIAQDDHFGGYDLPAGWIAILLPVFTNRLPDYFTDPQTFDPDRFLPPREEHKRHPYSFIGFGGGAHACIGENTARIEIKALLTLLLRRFATLELVPQQDLREVYLPLSRPKGDVWLSYRR